jgi:hypothetical protein
MLDPSSETRAPAFPLSVSSLSPGIPPSAFPPPPKHHSFRSLLLIIILLVLVLRRRAATTRTASAAPCLRTRGRRATFQSAPSRLRWPPPLPRSDPTDQLCRSRRRGRRRRDRQLAVRRPCPVRHAVATGCGSNATPSRVFKWGLSFVISEGCASLGRPPKMEHGNSVNEDKSEGSTVDRARLSGTELVPDI